MSTITSLIIILALLMIAVGGKQGWLALVSVGINFALVFLALVLMVWHFPPLIITIIFGILVLAITIFMGDENLTVTLPAFWASVIILIGMLIVSFGVVHFAQAQGFGLEDSDDLEGLSLLVHTSFLQLQLAVVILSTLGAIAEAAVAVTTGMAELREQMPEMPLAKLQQSGWHMGQQIVGTTLNTLFFGIFGGLLALFIWFTGLHYSVSEVLNNKIFVAEMVTALLSFLAVIITVPISAKMAVWQWSRTN